MKKKENGFTLVELMIAIAIIGILSSIAVYNYLGMRTKAQAAHVATNLHYIEDGIYAAIIDGVENSDFQAFNDSIKVSNLGKSPLGPYIAEGNFQDPYGIDYLINVQPKNKNNPDGPFYVIVILKGTPATSNIFAELDKMFPRTMSHQGNLEFIWVDSETLAVKKTAS